MAEKGKTVGIYFDEQDLAGLQILMDLENRTRSNMVSQLVREELARRGIVLQSDNNHTPTPNSDH